MQQAKPVLNYGRIGCTRFEKKRAANAARQELVVLIHRQ
jgi:hypothetical protein